MSEIEMLERELRAEQVARRELEEQVRHGFAKFDNQSVKLDLMLDQIRAEIARGDSRNEARITELQHKLDARFEAAQGQMDARFNAMQGQMDARFDAMQGQMDARFDELRELIFSLRS